MSLVELDTDFKNTWFITRPQRILRTYNLKIQIETFLALGDSDRWGQNDQDNFTRILNNYAVTSGADYLIDSNSGGARTRRAQIGPTLGLVYKNRYGVWMPTIAGDAIINADNSNEALIRTLLRYQFPNPYSIRKNGARINPGFRVKPFILLLELIDDDEINGLNDLEFIFPIIYGHNYECYEMIKEKILLLRTSNNDVMSLINNPGDVFHNPKPNGNQYVYDNIKDIANTFKSYLQGSQLIVRQIIQNNQENTPVRNEQRWKINQNYRALYDQLLLEKNEFQIVDQDNQEQFYQSYQSY